MDNLMEYVESIDSFEAHIDALNSERADEYRSILTDLFFEKYSNWQWRDRAAPLQRYSVASPLSGDNYNLPRNSKEE